MIERLFSHVYNKTPGDGLAQRQNSSIQKFISLILT